jgi:hypothetical protein
MPQSGAQRLVELEGRVATLEKELLEVRIGIGRLLRKYTQVQRRYLRRVPPRPTKLLRAMGLLGDAK